MDSNPLPITGDPNSTGQSSLDNLSVASDSDLLNGGSDSKAVDKCDPSASAPEQELKEELKNMEGFASTERRRSTSECNTAELKQKSIQKTERPSVPVNG